jgi:hypothetical protein
MRAVLVLIVAAGALGACGPRIDPQAELAYCRSLPDRDAVPCFQGITARYSAASAAINTVGDTMPRTYSGSITTPDGTTTRYRSYCTDLGCDTRVK